jgi:hypothetical protein
LRRSRTTQRQRQERREQPKARHPVAAGEQDRGEVREQQPTQQQVLATPAPCTEYQQRQPEYAQHDQRTARAA